MRINQDTLLDYVDGALDPARHAVVAAQLAQRPELQAELDRLLRLRRGLHAVFDTADLLPAPGPATWARIARRTQRRGWRPLLVVGVAAALFLMLVLSRIVATYRTVAVGALPGGVAQSATPSLLGTAQGAIPSGALPTIQLAQRVDALQGWALVRQALRWTDDGGAHWRTLAVPLAPGQQLEDAFFLDSQRGWALVAGPNDQASTTSHYSALMTRDGGVTWAVSSIVSYTDCYSCLDRSLGFNERDTIAFLNEREGWAVIDRTESANSLRADLFRTTDGGHTWQQLPLMPSSGPVLLHATGTGWLLGTCCATAPPQLW